jgi:hypothetical protein
MLSSKHCQPVIIQSGDWHYYFHLKYTFLFWYCVLDPFRAKLLLATLAASTSSSYCDGRRAQQGSVFTMQTAAAAVTKSRSRPWWPDAVAAAAAAVASQLGKLDGDHGNNKFL